MLKHVAPRQAGRSLRFFALAYASTGYVLAIAFWPIFIVFVGNLPRIQDPWLPKTISSAETILPMWQALAIDLGLIAAFALQHSILARPRIKQVWHRYVAEPFRRSTFVHVANIFAFALIYFWQPIPAMIWQFDHDSIWRFATMPLFALGWIMLLVGARSFDLKALFGLRQVQFWSRGQPYEPVDATQSQTYWLARHPEFLGVFTGLWVTNDLSVGHLLLAVALTLYSLIGLRMVEGALVTRLGQSYRDYQAKVPKLGPVWACRLIIGCCLVVFAVEISHTREQREQDASARSQLQQLRQAMILYRERHGAYPQTRNTATCEHAAHEGNYDALMSTLSKEGLLQAKLAHPDRLQGDLGLCYWARHINGQVVSFLWTSLDSAPLSNKGEPGTCRPFQAGFRYCRHDASSRDYCLCLP